MTTGDSKFRAPPSRAEPRASVSCDARGEINNTPACERLIDAERGYPFSDDAPDQPGTLVFIEFGRSGIAVPCLHFPFFHDGLNSQGARHDLA